MKEAGCKAALCLLRWLSMV